MEEMEDIHLDAGINIDTVALSRAVTKLGYCRDELLRCCEDLFANPNRFDLNPDTVDDLKRADKGLKNALKGHYEAFRDLGIAIDKLRFPPLSTDGNPGQKTAEQVRNYEHRLGLYQTAREQLEKALANTLHKVSLAASRHSRLCYAEVDQSLKELSRKHSEEHRSLIEYFVAVDELAGLIGVSDERIAEEQSRAIGNVLFGLFAIVTSIYILHFAIYELPRYLSWSS